MSWLLRSRALPGIWSAAALLVVATILLADRFTPLPELVKGSGIALPTALTMPVPVAVLLQASISSSHPTVELTSPRRLRVLDVSLLAVGTSLAVAAYVAVAVTREDALLFASARNLVGALGLALVCRRLLSASTVSFVVVAYASVSLMFGDRARPQLWAFLLATPGSRWAAVLGAVLLLAGVLVGTGDQPRVRQLTDEREM
ncbi:hypothetical protein GCM10027053_30190 [Intrasporangium mesophilum]